MRRNYHWFFAAVAALLVLVRYVPAVYLSAVTADHVQIPLLFHDVVELGHAVRDWNWAGHADIFPDITLVFLLESILRDGLLASQVGTGVYLAAYMTVLVVLYRQSGGRNTETFTAILLLFFVLLLNNFGVRYGQNFRSSLAFTFHTGTKITTLVCFALCQRAALKGWGRSFWWLPVLCFITSLSDDLFQVVFTVPALATLVATRLLYPDRMRLFLRLTGSILIPCAAGHFLAIRLSPFEIDPGPYTHFDSASAIRALQEFRKLCAPATGGVLVIFVALDFLYLLFAAVLIISHFFKPASKRIPLLHFMLLTFIACLISSNLGASILSGNLINLGATRHIRLALLMPPFLLLGCLNHIIPWSRATSRATVMVLSLAICACVIFLAPSPSRTYRDMQGLVPIIRAVMEKEHIEAGRADYSFANPIAFFSGETLPVRLVDGDGSYFHFVNTTEWYAGDGASTPPPRFRLIVMANLNPDKIRRRFGDPARIIPATAGYAIWIYPEEKSIIYNPIFRTLSNDPPNEYRTDADSLPFITGQHEGNSIVARAGRDRPNILTYGPYPYLQPAAGHYRITIVYTWLSVPDPAKPAGYDVVLWKGSFAQARTLDHGTIPFIDNSRREFTREIEIQGDGQSLLQVRTLFNGSGDFSVDSIRIDYLGK